MKYEREGKKKETFLSNVGSVAYLGFSKDKSIVMGPYRQGLLSMEVWCCQLRPTEYLALLMLERVGESSRKNRNQEKKEKEKKRN